MNNTKRPIILTLLCCALVGVLFLKDSTRPFDRLWENQLKPEPERAPASVKLDYFDIDLIKNYFEFPTYGKSINFKIKTKFYSNKDDEYLKKKAKLTIEEAFQKAFEHKNIEEKAGKLLGKNLYSSFIDNFIKTIGVTKIVNGQFQIDFEFIPEMQNNLNFESELSSNQLIRYNSKSNLTQFLTEEDKNISEKVANLPWPDSGSLYQYTGGIITLWFKTLDLVWHPSQPIPDPQRNAIKGFIRFRKYFKINPHNSIEKRLQNRFFDLDHVVHTKNEEVGTRFVTVDVYKSFNLESPIPKLDHVEIEFGKLLSSNIIHDSIVENLIMKDTPDIDTGELILKGKYSSEISGKESLSTQIKIKKLVFDFNKKEIDDDSKIVISLDGNRLPPSESGQLKNEIRDRLMRMSSIELAEVIDLDELFSGLTTEMKK